MQKKNLSTYNLKASYVPYKSYFEKYSTEISFSLGLLGFQTQSKICKLKMDEKEGVGNYHYRLPPHLNKPLFHSIFPHACY